MGGRNADGGNRLLEAADGTINSLVGLEYFDELGDGEEAFHLVRHAGKLHLASFVLYRGHRGDEGAKAGAVDPLHLTHVQHDLAKSFLEQAIDLLTNFSRVWLTHKVALKGQNSDITVHFFFDCHTGFSIKYAAGPANSSTPLRGSAQSLLGRNGTAFFTECQHWPTRPKSKGRRAHNDANTEQSRCTEPGFELNGVDFHKVSPYHSAMRIVTITALDDKGLRPYQTLRRPLEHQQDGIFVAEGEKVVRRLLESSLAVRSLLLTPEWLEVYLPVLEKKHPDVVVYIAPKQLLESIVGFHLHQGTMAVAAIPRPSTLQEALAQERRPRLFVAVDGLTNAENLGVLVRNCAAFGVDALIVGETSNSPYLRRAVRNSMGAIFNLPVVHVNNLVGTLQELRNVYGLRVLAAHPHTDRETLSSVAWEADCCIVFGSEGEGIALSVLEACDASFAIPMKNGVDSLNVASASAVVLYEVMRQRGNQGRNDRASNAASEH